MVCRENPSAPRLPAKENEWTVEVFYDGDCPLCKREIGWIRRLDRRHRVRLTDIASTEFDPGDYDKSMQSFMDEIQGRLPDGTWVTGVEVFRRIYASMGLLPLVMITRLPLLSHALDLGYRVFARNRLKLTGRCDSNSERCRI